jgi:hypothetical protein
MGAEVPFIAALPAAAPLTALTASETAPRTGTTSSLLPPLPTAAEQHEPAMETELLNLAGWD